MSAVETALDSKRRLRAVAVRELGAVAVVGVAILGGVAFRWFDLQRWSLWWDEGFTVWAAHLAPARIIPFARSDNQAPLYYLLQHYWIGFFGDSEFALRALSTLFGTLALPVFYLLAKKVLKDGIATALGMWLFAFSLKQIWYSREARAYEIASFFALLALYALVVFLERRSVWALSTLVVSSAVTLYLHNIMMFYLLGLDVVWLVYPSEGTWGRRIREMVLGNVCIGLLYLPWVVSLLGQVVTVAGNLYWVRRPTVWNVVWTLRDAAGFEIEYLTVLARRFLPLSAWVLRYGLSIGLVLLSGALLAGSFWRASATERRKCLAFVLYCVLPVFLIFILSQKMPLYLDRVFTTSSIVTPIIFAFPLAPERNARGKVLYGFLGVAVAIVAILSGFGFVRYGEGQVRNDEDWRGVIYTVATIPETNRLIVFAPPAGEVLFDYYARNLPSVDAGVARTGLPGAFYERFPPVKAKIIDEADINHLKGAVESRKYTEIDVVLTHDVDPGGLIADYLERRYARGEEPAPSGPKMRIRIIPFRLLPRPEPTAQGNRSDPGEGVLREVPRTKH